MSNTNQQTLETQVNEHHKTLYGKDGELGVTHKVAVIWRSYIWILCAASAFLGYAVSYLSDHIWK